jgi:outer membrane protein assembly factor BamB
MSELREALEELRGEFQPDPGGYDRLVRMRRRRRRTKRAGSVLIALLIAGAGVWFAVRAFSPLGAGRPGPAGEPLTPRTVGRLHLAWRGSEIPNQSWALRVVSGEVLMSSGHLRLDAFPTECPTRTCDVSWTASDLSEADSAGGPPAVAGDVAYAASNQLGAYPLGCGTHRASCSPLWTGSSRVPGTVMTSPTVGGGLLYVGTLDGRVLAFNQACSLPSHRCGPLWSAKAGATAVQFPPVWSGRSVYVVSDRLYAFPPRCPVGGRCRPEWSYPVSITVNRPAASGSWLYLSDGGRLLAFNPASCSRGGGCGPAWVFRPSDGATLSAPVLEGGTVYVEGARLYALPAACGSNGARCTPAWVGSTGTSSSEPVAPAIGDGMVFIVAGRRLEAFPELCSMGNQSCAPLWASSELEDGLSSPGIGPRGVYVIGVAGTLYAFAVSR